MSEEDQRNINFFPVMERKKDADIQLKYRTNTKKSVIERNYDTKVT